MKPSAVRIQNYRCIQDSGWVGLKDMAVIVGKNESGKTSFLKALWKFNPFHNVAYDIDHEFPAARRKERSQDKVVASVRFKLTPEETQALAAIQPGASGVAEVEVTRSYGGDYTYDLAPSSAQASEKTAAFIRKRLPVFVYMDDYRIFTGSAQLDEVLARKEHNRSTGEDETVMLLLEMAGLDLAEEVRKGNEGNRQQRILDMNDAGQRLTKLLANRWSQKKHEVIFQADGQHFITFIRDQGQTAMVPLEERSKGFQWFFSFDIAFTHETRGRFENAVLLLDEPGLHLHAAAQQDLLNRFQDYAVKNPLVFSTHLPFMIDFTRLDNIYVCEEKGDAGTKVHEEWATADTDARFALQAALGLSWSQSLFEAPFNLVVKDISDFWLLTTFSTMLRDSGEAGIDDQLVITPAGGANKVAYIGTMLHAQRLNVAFLLDSDTNGEDVLRKLVQLWVRGDRHVLRVGQILGAPGNRMIEDVFEEVYYLMHTRLAYQKELSGRNLTLPQAPERSVVERMEAAFKALGIPRFNRNRVARKILEDLAKKKPAQLPAATAENFRKLVSAINGLTAEWRKGGANAGGAHPEGFRGALQ
jgi:hypothetical protein